LPNQEDIWAEIDHTYVRARLGKEEAILKGETDRRLNQIYEERIKQGYAGPTYEEVIVTVGGHLERLPELVYDAYENVCRMQQKEITPEVVRSIYREAVIPEIHAAVLECIELGNRYIINMHIRSSSTSEPSEAFSQLARRVADYWRHESEIRAKNIEYAAGPKTLRSRRGRKKGQQTPERKALEKAYREVVDDLSRRDMKVSTRAIVSQLAKHRNTLLPRGWTKKYGIKGWHQVLSDPRMLDRAKKLFYKIKVTR
jgi:hypothetical protein